MPYLCSVSQLPLDMRRLMVVAVSLFLFLPPTPVLAQDSGASDLFKAAKKHSVRQEWNAAISKFQEIIDRSPESRYADDAQFWIGYCHEKKRGPSFEAYLAFERVLTAYPESPWTDDALVHQIGIAEAFVRGGKEQFRGFLAEKLQHPEPSVRESAAIALGQLGDPAALPALYALRTHEELGSRAAALAENIERSRIDAPDGGTAQPDPGVLAFRRSADRPDRPRDKSILPPSDFAFSPTARYKQYRAMLKMGDTWTRDELLDFGMFTILPTEEFEAYFALSGFDRSEWLRRYWTLRDPTPTTTENEALAEFERRLQHARFNYGRFWNHNRFEFQRDQYISSEWPHAPWDARGEIYIKYGEPDFVSIEGYNQEEWVFYNLGVDFLINRHMTNIYGEAISPGLMSARMNRGRFEVEFVYKKEFIYHHDYNAATFEPIQLKIYVDYGQPEENVTVHSLIPATEFSPVLVNAEQTIAYRLRYTVYDADMRPVRQDSLTAQRPRRPAVAAPSVAPPPVEERIPMQLGPGEYTLALRIEDLHSPKLGIYLEHFIVDREEKPAR